MYFRQRNIDETAVKSKLRTYKILLFVSLAVDAAFLTFLAIIDIRGIFAECEVFCEIMLVVFFIIALALWVAADVCKRLLRSREYEIMRAATSGILQQTLEEVFEDVTYLPREHLSKQTVDSARLFGYDKIRGKDYVNATYKGMGIDMSDIWLESVTNDTEGNTVRSDVFRGLWMICDFGKELSADVRVMERSRLGKALGMGGIKTENEAFNGQFKIRSENAEEALCLLTPHMTEYLVKMKREAETKLNLSFLRSGKLHIALDTHKNSFEFKGDMTDTAKIREQFVDEIRHVTDLIDELRLVDTMFKD